MERHRIAARAGGNYRRRGVVVADRSPSRHRGHVRQRRPQGADRQAVYRHQGPSPGGAIDLPRTSAARLGAHQMAPQEDARAGPYRPGGDRAARSHLLGRPRLPSVLLERSRHREGSADRRIDGISRSAEILRRARYRLEQLGLEDLTRSVQPRIGPRLHREPRQRKAAVAGALRDASFPLCIVSAAQLCRADGLRADPRLAADGGGDRRRRADQLGGDGLSARRFWKTDAPYHRGRRQTGAADPGRPGGKSPVADPSSPHGLILLTKILPYLRPYWWRGAWALAQVFLIAGFELLKPWPLPVGIDYVLGGKPPPTGGPIGDLLSLPKPLLLVVACFGVVAVNLGAGALTLLHNYTTIR